MVDRRKLNLTLVAIAILTIVFASITVQINALRKEQNDMISDLSQVEYLSSSTQRLARMIITNDKDRKVVFYIDEETTKNLDANNVNSLSLLSNHNIRLLADQVIFNWKLLYNLFDLDDNDENTSYDIDSIKLASDNHFNSMTDLSLLIIEETQKLSVEIEELQVTSYVVLCLIFFFVGNHLINTSIALRTSAKFAVIASLDIATGLYNRSRCQEIFKDSTPYNREHQPAVVVIDLNDLKTTNDIYGHRVGDELIATFANILKEAINVHKTTPFLGRYGGDEFVIYYSDIEKEDEIHSFISELNYITTEYNKQDNKKFIISYAVGYAMNISGKDGLSIRQLFEEADEKMYINKREMKKNQIKSASEVVNKQGGEQLA